MPKKTNKANTSASKRRVTAKPKSKQQLAAMTRPPIPADFRRLAPSMVDDPRGSALWSIRIRQAADLEAIREVLYRDIIRRRKGRSGSVMAYCRAQERLSRMLGMDTAEVHEHIFKPINVILDNGECAPANKPNGKKAADA